MVVPSVAGRSVVTGILIVPAILCRLGASLNRGLSTEAPFPMAVRCGKSLSTGWCLLRGVVGRSVDIWLIFKQFVVIWLAESLSSSFPSEPLSFHILSCMRESARSSSPCSCSHE